jgi:hypothetical protein
LAAVALNTLLGWWRADLVAALAMVPIIAKEGWRGSEANRPVPTADPSRPQERHMNQRNVEALKASSVSSGKVSTIWDATARGRRKLATAPHELLSPDPMRLADWLISRGVRVDTHSLGGGFPSITEISD